MNIKAESIPKADCRGGLPYSGSDKAEETSFDVMSTIGINRS